MRSRLCFRPQAGGVRGCGRVRCQHAQVAQVLDEHAQVLTTDEMVAVYVPNESPGRVKGRLVGLTVGIDEEGEFAWAGLRLAVRGGSVRDVEFSAAAGAVAADRSHPAMLPGARDTLDTVVVTGDVVEFCYPRRFSYKSPWQTTTATFVGLAPKRGKLDVTRVVFRANGRLLAVCAYPWLLGVRSLVASAPCENPFLEYDEDEFFSE